MSSPPLLVSVVLPCLNEAETLDRWYPHGSQLRVQLLHGKNPDSVAILREEMLKCYQCHWTPTVEVAPILGAHTGGTLVGLSIGPADLFKEVPGIIMS